MSFLVRKFESPLSMTYLVLLDWSCKWTRRRRRLTWCCWTGRVSEREEEDLLGAAGLGV